MIEILIACGFNNNISGFALADMIHPTVIIAVLPRVVVESPGIEVLDHCLKVCPVILSIILMHRYFLIRQSEVFPEGRSIDKIRIIKIMLPHMKI